MAIIKHYITPADNAKRVRLNTQSDSDTLEVAIDGAALWPTGFYVEVLNLSDNEITIVGEAGANITLFGALSGALEIPSNCYGRLSLADTGDWDFHIYGQDAIGISDSTGDNSEMFLQNVSFIDFWNGLFVRQVTEAGGIRGVRVVPIMRPTTTTLDLN